MIFFDIDNTLLNHTQAQDRAACSFLSRFHDRLSHSDEQFCALWNSVMQKHVDAFTRGEISFAEQRRRRIREIFAEVEPAVSDSEADARYADYLRRYEENWTLFDDVLPCLSALSDRRLGIISNGNAAQQKLKLRRLGLEGRFEVVVISDEVGIAKPDPRIFREACRRASLAPQECVYVGDNFDVDVLGSHAVGMKAVWLNRAEEASPSVTVTQIGSLARLRPLTARPGPQ